MSSLKGFVIGVHKLNDFIGSYVSLLIYPMIGFLVWEVFMRYFLNQPTLWAQELSVLLYAVYFLLGGSYALLWGAHINMDIIYKRLSIRKKAILDLVTWMFFYFFCGVIFWEGFKFAWISVEMLEHSSSVWEPPIWPVKVCIPLGGFLILLQGLSKTMRDLHIILTGHDLINGKR